MSVKINLPSGRQLTVQQIDMLLDKMQGLLDVGTAIGVLGSGKTEIITSQALFKRATAARIEHEKFDHYGEMMIRFTVIEGTPE